MSNEIQYLSLLEEVLKTGEEINDDRTGVGTYQKVGANLVLDVTDSIALLHTKRIYPRLVLGELLWMLSGSTNLDDLRDLGVNFWDQWEPENTPLLGPTYGHNIRHHSATYCTDSNAFQEGRPDGTLGQGKDQLKEVIRQLKEEPMSRRIIISTWNPFDVHNCVLPPCHGLVIQFLVSPNNDLDLVVYQRSADLFIGVPYNMAFYSMFMHLIANHMKSNEGVTLRPRRLHWHGGSVHVYKNHVNAVIEQLRRGSINDIPSFPTFKIYGRVNLLDGTIQPSILDVNQDPQKRGGKKMHPKEHLTVRKDCSLMQTYSFPLVIFNYNPLPQIEAPVAV